jgi:hypothetical protein
VLLVAGAGGEHNDLVETRPPQMLPRPRAIMRFGEEVDR